VFAFITFPLVPIAILPLRSLVRVSNPPDFMDMFETFISNLLDCITILLRFVLAALNKTVLGMDTSVPTDIPPVL